MTPGEFGGDDDLKQVGTDLIISMCLCSPPQICQEPMPVVDVPPWWQIPAVTEASPPVTAPVTTPSAPSTNEGSQQEDPVPQPPRGVDPALVGGILAGCIAAVLAVIGAYLALRSNQAGGMVTKTADEETTELYGKELPLSDTVITADKTTANAPFRTHGSSATRTTTDGSTGDTSATWRHPSNHSGSAATLSAVTSSPEELGYVQLGAILGQGFTSVVRPLAAPCLTLFMVLSSVHPLDDDSLGNV